MDFQITIHNLLSGSEYQDIFSAENLHDAVDIALQYHCLQLQVEENNLRITAITNLTTLSNDLWYKKTRKGYFYSNFSTINHSIISINPRIRGYESP